MTRIRPLMTAAALAAALFVARPALAGPPLLCFPFDIGTARSLPMGTGNWHATDPAYNVAAHLVDDTLALLTPQTPVLVRMETLRRATIYASTDAAVADALLQALQARAAKPTADAPLAVFDFGYLVETYREAKPVYRAIPAVDRINGYQLVLKAHAIARDDRMMHAAKLIEDGQPHATK